MRRWLEATLSARLAILFAGLLLIALTWLGTLSALRNEERAAVAHANAELTNKVAMFEVQMRRRLMAADQTLRILEDQWERDPTGFDLAYWYDQAKVLTDLALYLYVTDANGIIRQSTRPNLVGVDISAQEAFRSLAAKETDDRMIAIGADVHDPVTGQWQFSLARRLDTQGGQFAGAVGLGYDTSTIKSFLETAGLGSRGMIALVGTRRGRIFASAGAGVPEPGADIAVTPLYTAMQDSPDGTWAGKAVPADRPRLYAFRRVMDRPLEVVLGVDARQGLSSHYAWQRGAWIFAACTSLFLLLIMAVLTREMNAARNRETKLAADRLALEQSNARQAAARELAEARTAQLDATLLGISDGVSMVDADMRLVQWNARFSEFTGVPAEILHVGLPMADALRAQARLGEFGTVDVETEVARRMAILRSKSLMGVIQRVRPNGRVLELRRRSLPDGGFVTLYADITERKQAEQALEKAREIAEAAAADKSRFVAIVSHEIRTPLNTLLNALTLLDAGELPSSQRLILGVARQSGDALIGLLDDILEMSRADAGQLSLRPSTFALRPLLESVLAIFQDQAVARGIALRLEIATGVPDTLYSDGGRLRQVLVNLVSNAVKYARPGTAVLHADTRMEAGRTVLRLALRDCGPAIHPADRARLFQPFSRLEQQSDPLRPGTGLGLVICQRLTALLGGEIGYLEAAGDGNEFWITLPLQIAPAVIQDESPEGTGPRSLKIRQMLPRTRVLLVDDIAANRAIIATLLRREGHLVDVAGSGAEAVAAVRGTPYDIVLMDIFMPDMNGLDATRTLRSMGGMAASIPILALTANTGGEERDRCIAAGMNDRLSKPVEMSTLIAAIAAHAWPGYPIRELPPPDQPPAEARLESPVLDQVRLAELRSNLAPELLAQLVEQCLQDIAVRVPELHRAIAAARFEQIEAQAHALAGMAASYAMALLEGRLRPLIQAARVEDAAALRAAAAGLDGDLARTEASLRSIFSPVSA